MSAPDAEYDRLADLLARLRRDDGPGYTPARAD